MYTWVNEDSWEIMKNYFPDAKQIKKCPKTALCKECKYVQKYINGKDDKIDPPEDIEQIFFSSYFIEKPNLRWKVLN